MSRGKNTAQALLGAAERTVSTRLFHLGALLAGACATYLAFEFVSPCYLHVYVDFPFISCSMEKSEWDLFV